MTEPTSPESGLFYGRVSTNRQDTSLTDQNEAAHRYGASRLKPIHVEQDFTDPDTSGSVPFARRRGGAALLAYLAEHPDTKHLIVSKLDRLGRDSLDGEVTCRLLRGRGITLHILDLGGDTVSTAGPIGELILKILFAVVHWDRQNIQANVARAMRAKRTRGELCGTVPYGKRKVATGRFTAKGKEFFMLEDNPAEQHWLRQMIRWRRLGQSYQQVANALNAEGVPSKVPAGTAIRDNQGRERLSSGRWQAGNVQHVLNNSYTRQLCAQLDGDEGNRVAA